MAGVTMPLAIQASSVFGTTPTSAAATPVVRYSLATALMVPHVPVIVIVPLGLSDLRVLRVPRVSWTQDLNGHAPREEAMTADVRVELARDYLEAHSRDAAWLPPSALAREVTELRTHLAAVLAVLDARPAADRPMCCD